MAKRARAPAALLALLMAPAVHAEVKFTPSIGASETYSDNPGLLTGDQAQGSFITELTPAFSVVSNGPRLTLAAGYQLHLYSYSQQVNNTNNTSSQYQANMHAKLIDQLLDLDASAVRQVTSLSAFGPQGTGSLYSNNNRTNISTYTIAPTLRHRFGGFADGFIRYSRNRVAGDPIFGTTSGNNITANLTSGQDFSVIGWGVNATEDSFSGERQGNTESQNVEANVRYRTSAVLSLTATAGYDKYDYASQSDNATQGPSYTGGFILTPSARTRLQMSYGHRYYGNTGSMAFSFRSHRSAVTANYSDTVTTSRQNYLSTSALSTNALLDAMLTASIPDPIERQKAIAAYIAATGVTPTLANNTNYLSNVFQRQRLLQAAYSLEGAHSTSILALFKSRTEALSTQTATSNVLGQNLALLNNNLDSIGANLSYTQRMTHSTRAIAALDYQHSKSLDTGYISNTETVRLGVTHSFDAKLQGAAEIRHTQGSYYNVGSSNYRENAISATILMQF